VKKDYKRFPRAQVGGGTSIEYFSVVEGYSDATRDADARAFAALMRHIKEVDGQQHTVILAHVENEVGMAGDSRDRSPGADKAFAAPVPQKLMDYLRQHKDTLIPEFRQVWERAGFKTSGSWEEVFGKGAATDEIFMVWNYAQYVGRVTEAGKAEYPIPMYTNGWVTRRSSIAAVAAKGIEAETKGYTHSGDPMFDLMDVEYTVLGDSSDVWDTPTDGEFRMYDGGTTLEDAALSVHAKGTISMQEFCTEKTLAYIKEWGHETASFNHPIGVGGTDKFLMEVSRITGKPIPEALARERGRLVDAIADSNAHIHGKKFALYGDPDLCLGLAGFLLELGAEPTHILSTNGGKAWEAKVRALLASSPFGANCNVYAGKDLWHMRSLLFTDPVDFLIGNTYGKYLERDTGTPLIRIGFPVFDRHHHHRRPVWGYQGGMNVLITLLDKIFDVIDNSTNVPAKTDFSFDIIR